MIKLKINHPINITQYFLINSDNSFWQVAIWAPYLPTLINLHQLKSETNKNSHGLEKNEMEKKLVYVMDFNEFLKSVLSNILSLSWHLPTDFVSVGLEKFHENYALIFLDKKNPTNFVIL